MMCPVCKRDLAPTLSICLTCGTMMNDSVREELQSKVSSAVEPARPELYAPADKRDAIPEPILAVKRPAVRIDTSDLRIKKTSPTLAEFRTNSATLPDWRLQLQNTIRQRTGRADHVTADAISPQPKLQTSGANALKAEYVEEPAPAEPLNLKVANALKRIEESRRTFLPEEKKKVETAASVKAAKNFPFNVVSRSDELPPRPAGSLTEPAPTIARPKLVSSLRIEKRGLDTNKLVPIPEAAKMASSFEITDDIPAKPKKPLKEDWSKRIEIKETKAEAEVVEPEIPVAEEVETDEIDDLAPVAMRFNAGLFDMIIGGFATLILLSPLLFASEGWISFSGFFAFTSVLAIVMFAYLTASISYFGQTFGMRVFSLELVDVEQSEYPTLQQAAVSSSVYLLSLALGGLGFLPILFNEERRAVHDLVSGTILLREL
jgi:uncharacterized RDD family membrane protein YckC